MCVVNVFVYQACSMCGIAHVSSCKCVYNSIGDFILRRKPFQAHRAITPSILLYSIPTELQWKKSTHRKLQKHVGVLKLVPIETKKKFVNGRKTKRLNGPRAVHWQKRHPRSSKRKARRQPKNKDTLNQNNRSKLGNPKRDTYNGRKKTSLTDASLLKIPKTKQPKRPNEPEKRTWEKPCTPN